MSSASRDCPISQFSNSCISNTKIVILHWGIVLECNTNNVHQGNAFQPTRPRTVAPAIIDVYSFPMALRLVTMESASSHVILVIFSKITNACPLVLVTLEPLLIAITTAVNVAKRLKIAITQKLLALKLPHLNLLNQFNHDNLTSPHCRHSLNLSHPPPPEPAKRWLSSRSDGIIPKLPSPASDR